GCREKPGRAPRLDPIATYSPRENVRTPATQTCVSFTHPQFPLICYSQSDHSCASSSDLWNLCKEKSHMSTEQNKAIVRRFLEDYTPAVVDDLLVPNYIHHDPSLPPEMQQ